MLRILSSFATNATRYYNLDIIQGIHKGIEDPLSDWYRNVVIPCWEQSVSPRIKRLEEERAIMASSLMEEFAMVRFTSEDGQSISTVKEGAYRTGIWKRTAPYVRLHALQWCRYLTENIIALDQSHQDLPVFSDMYRVFYNDDKMFLGRKTWELV